MKIMALMIVSIITINNLYGQIDTIFSEKSLKEKITVIKEELRNDTLKYDKNDLIHRVIGTQNSKNYGKLYIINGKQYFKSDIVDSNCIEDFIENYLQESNVINIEKLNTNISAALYGSYGANGVVVIRLKKLKRAKTTKCNFKLNKKLTGSNHNQLNDNGVIIRD